jgi:hypothetical protein
MTLLFNNGTFTEGGRFYGGFHLALPKAVRRHILINQEPTVEPDFSALHIRMLYHLEGIDYREDAYAALCDSKEERKVFKIIFLVAINAETKRKAIYGIQKELDEKGIPFDTDYHNLKACLQRIKDVHGPISKYLNTGVGLKLQNLDSRITDLILKTLTHEEIPVLPVHDSFIVRERDRDRLIEVMRSSYFQLMGYDPVIKWEGLIY